MEFVKEVASDKRRMLHLHSLNKLKTKMQTVPVLGFLKADETIRTGSEPMDINYTKRSTAEVRG